MKVEANAVHARHTPNEKGSEVACFRTKAAAKYLGLGESTLTKWRLRGRPHGRGPRFVKLGKTVLYRREDLDQWLSEQNITA